MTQEEFNAMLAVGISQGLPGSYYTSRYKNGEEIDRRLGNAAVPAVGDNILINADFRNPVNRNGQTVYTSRGFCIDNWFAECPVTIESDCISISASIGSGIFQALERVPNGPLTFSIIVKEGKGVLFAENNQAVYFSGAGLYFITYQNGINPITDKIYIRAQDYSTLKLVAAKLESGSTQTLAKQNSDGKWEPIAPPNYPLQYALCSQYSPSTGEWVGSQHSNPNLLDNWYFVDPVNQRDGKFIPAGTTYYSDTALTVVAGVTAQYFKVSHISNNVYSIDGTNPTMYVSGNDVRKGYINEGYTIDRWMVDNNGGQGSLKILDGFIRGTKIALSSNGGTSHAIHTAIEMAPRLSGKTVTLSAMVRGTGGTAVLLYTNHGIVGSRTIDPSTNWTLCSVTVELPNDLTYLSCFLYFDLNRDTMGYTDFYAAKLELGAQQTLAHKEGDTWVLNDPPPNRALELAKCQRYYRRFDRIVANTGGVPTPYISPYLNYPDMRVTPLFLCHGGIVDGGGLPINASIVRAEFTKNSGVFIQLNESFSGSGIVQFLDCSLNSDL